jgi:hypothetical protein
MSAAAIDPPASAAWRLEKRRPWRADEPRPERPNSYVYHADMRLLYTMCQYASWRGRTWFGGVTLKRLAELMLMFAKRMLSERSLCDHLGALERDGWIKRFKQHRYNRDGSLELRPTHYVLTNRAWAWARGLGLNVKKRFTASPKPLPLIALQYSAEMTLTPAVNSSNKANRAARAPPKTG